MQQMERGILGQPIVSKISTAASKVGTLAVTRENQMKHSASMIATAVMDVIQSVESPTQS